MRIKVIVPMVMLLLIAPGIIVGAGATTDSTAEGKWSGEIPGPRGDSLSVVFEFKVTREKLEGSVSALGKEFPISEGKVKGDGIGFRIEGDTPFYTGEISGDTIKMKQTWKGGEKGTRIFSFTLTRVKS